MGKLQQQIAWYLVGYLREPWGKFWGKSGKNYLILERSVGETFMNPWKLLYNDNFLTGEKNHSDTGLLFLLCY